MNQGKNRSRTERKRVERPSEVAPSWLTREIHDGVLQQILYLSMELSSLADEKDPTHDEIRDRIHNLVEIARRSYEELRELIDQERHEPVTYRVLGEVLSSSVESVHAKTDLNISLDIDEKAEYYKLQGQSAHNVEAIVNEALWNASRHGKPQHVTISLKRAEMGGVVLRVSDDGVGFDMKQVPEGRFGLQSMRDRAAAVGARLDIVATKGSGVEVTMYLPKHVLKLR